MNSFSRTMAKPLALTFLLILCIQFSFSQKFEWGAAWGSIGNERSRTVDVDNEGNVYMAAHFRDSFDLDPGPGTQIVPVDGALDMMISKLDKNGNLIWAYQFSGSGSDDVFDLVADQDQNVYITGAFMNTVDFDPGPGVFNLTAVSSYDMYVMKLDSAGDFVWAKTMGGIGTESGYGIYADEFGQVYVTGTFNGTVDFDPGPATFNLTAVEFLDMFITKLDVNGDLVWVKQIGGTSNESGWSVQLTPANEILLAGVFNDAADLDPGPGTFNVNSVGNQDNFLVTLDTNGNFISGFSWGGTGVDYCFQALSDADGNVYAGGYFSNTVDFDPGPGVSNFTSLGNTDAFLTKFDSTGAWQWTNPLGSSSLEWGLDIDLDPWGNPYLTGTFNGVVDFDPSPNTFNMNGFQGPGFIAQYLPNGNLGWALQFTSSGLTQGVEIAVGQTGDIHLLGDFAFDLDMDPDTSGTTTVTSLGNRDVFLTKLTQCTTQVDTSVSVAANMVTANLANASYQWLDCNNGFAPIPGETGQSYSPSVSGSYAVSLLENFCLDTSACVPVVVVGTEGSLESAVTAFPNPINDRFRLRLPDGVLQGELTIRDATGKVVLSQELDGIESKILLDSPAGVYFLEVKMDTGQRSVLKILKL